LAIESNGKEKWRNAWPGDDVLFTITDTQDHSYILGGAKMKYNPGGWDARLMKVDSQGQQVWEQTFGWEEWTNEVALSVQESPDSGYVLTGYTTAFLKQVTGCAIFLIKTDQRGQKLWHKIFREDAGYSTVYRVLLASDGGYLLLAETNAKDRAGTNGQVGLIKTDVDGKRVWDKTFMAGTVKNGTRCMQATPDNGYIIAAFTELAQGTEREQIWLFKTDALGNKLWEHFFGGPGKDVPNWVITTRDNGYLIVGSTTSFGAGQEDFWVIKTDSQGDKVWDKTFGGAKKDEAWGTCQTLDGGYLVVGDTASFGPGEVNAWIINLDADGKLVQTFK
jgi:hypothetical protein